MPRFQSRKPAVITPAQQGPAMEVPLLRDNTTWMERFRDALRLMCGAEPPLQFCEMWIRNEQNEAMEDPLQVWVNEQVQTPAWAQGIVTIDAARVWADSPCEGERHQPLPDSD
jgi:hypothetical protein